jgi:hypothetical protein
LWNRAEREKRWNRVEREEIMSIKKVEEDSCKSRSINIKQELIAQEESGVWVGRAVGKAC